jgi:hypothetical protein
MTLDSGLTTVEAQPATTTPDPPWADDLIIEQARRRHRRRLLGVSAVVVVLLGLIGFGMATMLGGSPHPSSGRTVSTRPPPDQAAHSSCSAGRLVAKLTSTGSTPRQLRAALLTITNESASRCEILTFPKLRLLDGVGKVIATVSPPGQVDVRVQLPPHSSAIANLYWQNWCGIAERPISLQVVLPNRGGTLAALFGGPESSLPTCTDPSQASSFVAVGGLDSGSLFGAGHQPPG